MTHQQNLDLIRTKCIAANPAIRNYEYGIERCERHQEHPVEIGWTKCENCVAADRPIRFADLLLALEKATDCLYTDHIAHLLQRYNLREDDLTKQSEETITFITNLLQ